MKQNKGLLKKKILKEINKNNKEKNDLQNHQNVLKYNKKILVQQKENNEKEKDEIHKKINDFNNQILSYFQIQKNPTSVKTKIISLQTTQHSHKNKLSEKTPYFSKFNYIHNSQKPH